MATGDWWRHGVIYQIYPRSFADANGDGVGDLAGITARLDHLNDGTPDSLGVDAIWLSPFYPSPMADFGYDVADYTDVDPVFGTLDDFDRLVAEAHARGIRVVVDLVPNHTSDRHPWFLESRSSRDNPKRDWYVWADSRPDGSPPNNWMSSFPGPAGPGPSTSAPASGTCTRSCPSSPTSTGGTRRSGRPWTGSCGSGWTGASTASGSTSPTRWPTTPSCSTTRWSSWTTRTWARARRRGTAGGPS